MEYFLKIMFITIAGFLAFPVMLFAQHILITIIYVILVFGYMVYTMEINNDELR